MERLQPDAAELHIASHKGSTSACPFCGEYPLLTTDQNETTGLYVARMFCSECNCSMHSCMPTREAAQQNVIQRWAKRA